MIATLPAITALLLSVAILVTGNGLQGVLVPIRANLESFPTIVIGLLASAYYLGYVVGCFLVPWVVRRVGHIRAFAAFCAIASAVALIHALIVEPRAWAVLRVFSGFCFAGLYVVIESWLNERASNENRGQVLSVYRIIDLGALTAGQLLLPLADPLGFTLFSLIAILVSLALVPVCMTTAQAPGPIMMVSLRLRRLYTASPLGTVGVFGVGLANGSFWALATVFATRSGMELNSVAYFMALSVVGGVVLQWPIGWLSDRIDRRQVLTGTTIAASLSGLALVVFGGWSPTTVLALGCLYGGLSSPLYSLAVSHANDYLDTGDFVEASGGLMFFFSVGAVIGPLLAAQMMELIGPPGLFAFTAMAHGALGAFAIYRMRQRAPLPPEEQAPFVAFAETTPQVLELDPRAPDMEETPETPESPETPADAADSAFFEAPDLDAEPPAPEPAADPAGPAADSGSEADPTDDKPNDGTPRT